MTRRTTRHTRQDGGGDDDGGGGRDDGGGGGAHDERRAGATFWARASPIPPLSSLRLVRARATLVVVPAPLLAQWEAEAARHAPALAVARFASPPSLHAAELAAADLVLTTYDAVRRELRRHGVDNDGALGHSPLLQCEWHRVVLDEANLEMARRIRISSLNN